MNPWFATAAGVMIAASLWVYHPHAQLSLPFATPSMSHCTATTCTSQAHDHRSQASTGGQRLPKHHARKRAGHAGQKAGAGHPEARPVISYRSGPSWQGSVLLVITMPTQPSKNWTLTLTMPGDSIVSVGQARWERVGTDGVTVSGGPGESTGYGPGQGQDKDQGGRGPNDRSLRSDWTEFTVWATGKTSVPAGCVLNGASCIFKAEQASHAAG